MYAMTFGRYSWYNNGTYQLLRTKAVSANLTKQGGQYVGWYFYQEDGTFNNFMYHDVFDNYPRWGPGSAAVPRLAAASVSKQHSG